MGTRAIWDEIVEALRCAPDPYECSELSRLWDLAVAEAPHVLGRYRSSGDLDDERIADLTKDFLVEHLPALLQATSPSAYFRVALQNAAISWLRRGSARIESPDRTEGDEHGVPAVVPDPADLIDARDFLITLSQREYDVLVGLRYGVDREELARVLGISRANLDQIVSRVRRRFPMEEP